MTNLTHRQFVEVNSELDHTISWKYFVQWLETKRVEKQNEADAYSDDITKLLKREQALGAAQYLGELYKEFSLHVSHKINTTKKEEEKS